MVNVNTHGMWHSWLLLLLLLAASVVIGNLLHLCCWMTFVFLVDPCCCFQSPKPKLLPLLFVDVAITSN